LGSFAPSVGAAKVNNHHGPEYVQSQAKTAAAALIKKAARFVEANIPSPVFKKRFTHGKGKLTAQFEYPGVLKVIDHETGDVMAVSAPGMPEQLCPNFKPYTPALEQSVIVDR